MRNNKVTCIFLYLFLSTILLACTVDHNAGNAVHKIDVTVNKQDIDVVNTGVVASNAIVQTYPLHIGDYLTVEYIEILLKTRSPLKAFEQTDDRQYIAGKMLDGKPNFTMMGGFHQGLGGFGLSAAGEIEVGIYGNKLVAAQILSNSELILKFEDKSLVYRYVGNLDQFISLQTLVGIYKDNSGAIYSFSKEGLAQFPNRNFHYIVMSDFTMTKFDHFIELLQDDDAREYGFKFVKNELQLFVMGGPMGNKPERNPFVTLTRIGDAKDAP